ncbi:MAG: type I DNA topoisomerase [Eubacteriales bacterium]|nr:type I DNA topoisomerase [Eubacteriales bacterium]
MANKKLVIVESPSKAKTISNFLGKNYKVIASQGHVRDLPKSQLGIDTQNDFDMKYITIRGKGPLMAQIRKEAKSADEIYLATDPDREGEAISWHLANLLNIDPNSKCRVEFNEITKETVKHAIKSPRLIDMHKVDAQQARRALDRLVGYGISPLLWAKVKKGLSAGRVQSVATKLVVDREREIESFIPEEYWEIYVTLSNAKSKAVAKLVSIDGAKANITTQAQAEQAEKRIQNAHLVVEDIKTSTKKRTAAPPFITSTLQQAAVSKLNFSTAKTMQVVQQLYEGINLGKKGTVGLVTYIRTDSVRVSTEALDAARIYIKNEYGDAYLPTTANVYKGRNNAQDAHEAIRPTYLENTPESIAKYLNKDQLRLYSLIFSRFIASQMAPAVYDVKNIAIGGDGVKLNIGYEKMQFDGFQKLYNLDETDKKAEKIKEDFEKSEVLKVQFVDKKQNFTQPKAHYTEASLVKELEDKGIGRPSTYAPTISTVIARGYISKEGKKLYASDLGVLVSDILAENFKDIIDYDFTAAMENQLDSVAEGNLAWKKTLQGFYPHFSEELKQADKAIAKIEVKDEVSDVECDKCGRMMVYKMGKFGRFLACPGFPECTNTKPILEFIDVTCPDCGGRLLKKVSKKRKRVFYGCENYPDCNFTSWDKPTNKLCEKCGSYMVEKPNKSKKIYLCSNKQCNHKVEEMNE